MTATSSRFDDFMASDDRADGHILDGDEWIVTPSQRQPDAQSPAGGVSSSVTDMATWLSMLLDASGPDAAANDVLTPEALLPAITAQSVAGPRSSATSARASTGTASTSAPPPEASPR